MRKAFDKIDEQRIDSSDLMEQTWAQFIVKCRLVLLEMIKMTSLMQKCVKKSNSKEMLCNRDKARIMVVKWALQDTEAISSGPGTPMKGSRSRSSSIASITSLEDDEFPDLQKIETLPAIDEE